MWSSPFTKIAKTLADIHQMQHRAFWELYELLEIKSIYTIIYHPQTDGLVKRFNQTLTNMTRKLVYENWDNCLEPLLFYVLQASTGFSPFKLLYGRKPHSFLDIIRKNWDEGPSESKSAIQYFTHWGN